MTSLIDVHRRSGQATVRGLFLMANAFLSLASFILTVLSLGFVALGVGIVVLPWTIKMLRWTANHARQLAGEAGVEIAEPYLPAPPPENGLLGKVHRTHWIFTDPATWRDLLWSLANSLVGFLFGLLPVTMLGYAVEGLLMPTGLWMLVSGGDATAFILPNTWPRAFMAGFLGLVMYGAWLSAPYYVVKGHAIFTKTLLSPTKRSKLADRVKELSDTRTEIIDIQAAELRRIERDLHDGAQARLVAIGMKLGAADRYLESDVDSARTLLTEAREASVKALEELRNLVRGIHPPVLAERGLGPAIHALALESPLDVELVVDLPKRLYPPLESAAYFAVSELLTNAAKHADARHVEIEAWLTDDLLCISITDDGRGGADINKGTGLRGIGRRCAAFDGRLEIRSPVGGPTVATLELPCALSSPKTSTY